MVKMYQLSMVLVMMFLYLFVRAVTILRASKSTKDQTIAIFAIITTVAIIVPNLFNAGLLLGFVWIFFGLVAIITKVT